MALVHLNQRVNSFVPLPILLWTEGPSLPHEPMQLMVDPVPAFVRPLGLLGVWKEDHDVLLVVAISPRLENDWSWNDIEGIEVCGKDLLSVSCPMNNRGKNESVLSEGASNSGHL